MLNRSTEEYRQNFARDEVTATRIGSEANGYAANVSFAGRDGRILVALVDEDCYVGWTYR